MARPQISEAQFVFGYLHHYMMNNYSPYLKFVIPTPFIEGDFNHIHGGADLIINNNLFFQFKVSDYLSHTNSSEIRKHRLTDNFLNYYRFNIKNEPDSYQFDKLKNTAFNSYNVVKYIAPMFFDEDGFFDFYHSSNSLTALNKTVSIDLKQFIANNISLTQTNNHVICYNENSVSNGLGYLFSEKKTIKIVKGIEKFEIYSQQSKDLYNKKLGDFLKELNKLFEANFSTENSISEIQSSLIIRFNIFWIPVLRT